MKKWIKPKGKFNRSDESIDRYFNKFYELNKDRIKEKISMDIGDLDDSEYRDYWERYKNQALQKAKNEAKWQMQQKEMGKKYSKGALNWDVNTVMRKVLRQETFGTSEERSLDSAMERFKKSKVYKEFRAKSKKKGRYVKTNLENAVSDGTFRLYGKDYQRYKITNEAGTFYVMQSQSPEDDTYDFYFYTEEDWNNLFSQDWEEIKEERL